ncbi:MAG: phosphotransferase, partial [Acidimicrobiales bacterium]
ALVSVANLARGLHRLEELAPAMAPRDLGAAGLGRQFRRHSLLAASGDQTLLHGDAHPGNTYVTAGGDVGFLDWQLARTGHWSHDVGYFLVGSLDVADRRRHERNLLAGYLDELGRSGVVAPSWESAWARYRAAPAFGLATWVHTLSFGTFQPVGVCVATIRRYAAAYEDLDTARSTVASDR